MQNADFNAIEKGLEQASSNMRAAEAHGVLCGMLCAGGAVSHKDWLNLLMDEWDEHNVLTKELITHLSVLHVVTLQNLNDSELKFYLFLPDDDKPIVERVADLSNWCQGFLFGFGLHAKQTVLQEHEQVMEAVEDIKDIGQVTIGEADESDYVEVTEYIRMAILMIYDTLQPVKSSEIKIQ